jgi:hypothetical protein
VIQGNRDFQRGGFAHLAIGRVTVGVYAFNPDAGSRNAIVSLGIDF